ncbi:Protein of unknown function [Pyronema omphalodes CBS 100304]|uniref:Uncharacterized protein n=1 Tax=Pyronema omphalodes (strain CBS 100304) TaxID=1076935 RepID=U4LVE9_PYROM|nr:Protein of unknown function [Pyronema omphalodes CBS 100304]
MHNTNVNLKLGNNSAIHITQEGTISLYGNSFTCLFCPSFPVNLLSISQLDVLGVAGFEASNAQTSREGENEARDGDG